MWTANARRYSAVLAICLTLLPACSIRRARFSSPAPQAATGRGWDEVGRLTAGERLRVKRKNGANVSGRLAAVEDQAIIVGDNRIPRAEVLQVERFVGDSPFNGLAIGAAIGFASGFGGEGLIFHVAGDATGYPDSYSWAAGLVGAIVGAVTGLITDAARKKHVTVYQGP
jgi:hypothetical protein